MSLSGMNGLLKKACIENRAVGAFNVFNMEMLMGVIRAAENENTDIIIQIAEKRLMYAPLHLIAPMMVSAAAKAKVNVAVQLDHGYTKQVMTDAKDFGFTSIMYDGSEHSLNENISRTAELMKWASFNNLDLEAEIGVLSGDEGGGDLECKYTKPEEAALLAEKTGCTALAVSIGNAHGHYKGKPKLNFDILERIHNLTSTPLVLHGGTGISKEDFRRAISMGVRKINVATANMDALIRGSKQYLDTTGNPNYFDLNEKVVECVCDGVCEHIKIFNNR